MENEPEIVHDDTQPVRPRQRGDGCVSWLTALIALVVAAALIFVGLFLPPINLYDRLFGTQYAMLSAQSNAVRSVDQGLTLVVDPANPGQDFGAALQTVSMNDFLAGNAQTADWIPEAKAAAPPYLALQSNVYSISTTGTPPGSATLTLTVPPPVANRDIVDLYGWDAQSDQWKFIPSHSDASGALTATVKKVPEHLALFQAAPLDPTVLVAVDVTQTLSPDVAQLATIIAPAGLQPTLQGALTGSLAPGFDLAAGYRVMPVVRNFADPRALDPDTVAAILSNKAVRSEHVRQITAFVSSGRFAGVFIDYRDLPPDQRDNFSAFIGELGASLKNINALLGVVVPAATSNNGAWDTGAYDWQAIGASADYLQIDFSGDPAAFEPGKDRLVEAMLRWAVGEVSRYKLLLGLSALSVRDANGTFTTIGYDEALSALGNVKVISQTTPGGTIPPGSEIQAQLDGTQAVSGFDTRIQSPFIDYQADDGSKIARMWLATGSALRFRMNRTVPFELAGVAFEDLLAKGIAGDVLPTILEYKAQIPAAPSQSELALRWSIQSASGVVGQTTTGLNDKLVVTVSAPDGNYAINVAVVGGSAESARGGAAVAVFAPTLTPTPLPTATPTPPPTATPTPVPVVPTQVASSGVPAAGPAVRPGAGSIAGGFEYGGHVTNTATGASDTMKRAGMTWMKVQLRYSLGMGADSAATAINDAHSNGFKILLGIPGVPSELAAGGADYLQQYAQFLASVAARGPDAIEVWNEQNLDREWPHGQISAASYTEMLRQAYQAIKSANGNVLVISGAPAPTGAENAYPGAVENDDRFVREMVAAGALQYMDCLGAHYNEGITPPSQTSGDPRDNYYTRYFWGMVNTYWNITGGQKPLCFTELGYLTPEGYPPLPGSFGWAQNVTLAQQAAWLAQAVALASQSGKVRLIIVWNVDFSAYGSDPQGGYAMIRPGGGCPACDALAAAR
jgi:spore germination protein YaaH